MFSVSRHLRFLPYQTAIKTLVAAQQSFQWPPPETCCKLLYETTDMAPKLKLVIFSILKNRHLLLCPPSSRQLQQQQQQDAASQAVVSFPPADTIKAYASALKAANEFYEEQSLGKKKRDEFPCIGSLTAEKWLPNTLWTPTNQKLAKSATQKIMQPRTAESFIEEQKTAGDSTATPTTTTLSRIRLVETPSIVAEVWSNILSENLLTMIQATLSGILESKPETHAPLIIENSTKIIPILDLLSMILFSRDHLLFDAPNIDQITKIAVDWISLVHFALKAKTSQKSLSANLLGSYCNVVAALAFSIRMRGGCDVLSKSSTITGTFSTTIINHKDLLLNFLTEAHHLSLTSAKFTLFRGFSTSPDENELVLPLTLFKEIVHLSASVSRNGKDLVENHLQQLLKVSCNVVLQQEQELIKRRHAAFEERLEEIAVLNNRIRESPHDHSLKEKRQKHEEHVQHIVRRDAEISRRIDAEVKKEIEEANGIFSRFFLLKREEEKPTSSTINALNENSEEPQFEWKSIIDVVRNEKDNVFNFGLQKISTSSAATVGSAVLSVDDEVVETTSANIELPSSFKNYQKYLVLFSKQEVSKILGHRQVATAPSESFLFLRWLTYESRRGLTWSSSSSLKQQNFAFYQPVFVSPINPFVRVKLMNPNPMSFVALENVNQRTMTSSDENYQRKANSQEHLIAEISVFKDFGMDKTLDELLFGKKVNFIKRIALVEQDGVFVADGLKRLLETEL